MNDIDIEAGDPGKPERTLAGRIRKTNPFKSPDKEVGDTGRDARGRLIKGHKMLPGSGRLPGVRNWNARRVAESLGVSPLIVALTVIKTGYFPLAKGEDPKDQRRASPELFTKILLDTLKLVVPSLSSVQLTGNDGGPVAVATMDVTQLMASPELARAAQLLALGIASQPQAQLSPAGDDESGHFLYEDPDPTPRR